MKLAIELWAVLSVIPPASVSAHLQWEAVLFQWFSSRGRQMIRNVSETFSWLEGGNEISIHFMLLEYVYCVCVLVHDVCTCVCHMCISIVCVSYVCVVCAVCMHVCVCELHAHGPMCVETWQTHLVQRECQAAVCFFQVETWCSLVTVSS